MDSFWEEMTGLYGYMFTRQFGYEPTNAWSSVMVGLTPGQIKQGISRCLEKHLKYPPNPIEFRDLCLSPDLKSFGLLEGKEAFQHACVEVGKPPMSRSWHHPAIYEAALRVGISFFKDARPGSYEERRFIETYQEVCEEVVSGRTFEVPALEHRKKEKPLPPVEAKKRAKSLKASLGYE